MMWTVLVSLAKPSVKVLAALETTSPVTCVTINSVESARTFLLVILALIMLQTLLIVNATLDTFGTLPMKPASRAPPTVIPALPQHSIIAFSAQSTTIYSTECAIPIVPLVTPLILESVTCLMTLSSIYNLTTYKMW